MQSIGRLGKLSFSQRALVAAAAFTLCYALLLVLRVGGEEGLRYLSEVGFQLPPMAATAACAVAALRTAGRERAGWAVFAAGVGCWAAAEWIWGGYDLFLRAEPPLVSVADPLYYVGYPLLMTGVVLLVVPARASRVSLKSLLDALLLVTVLAAVAWRWLLTPIYEHTAASTFDVLVTFGYPVLDFALLTAVILVFYRVDEALSLPNLLLVIGVLMATVADSVYLYLATVSGYDIFGNPLELGWVVSYLAFCLAAVVRIEQRQRSLAEAPKLALSKEQRRLIGLALPYLALVPLLTLYALDLTRPAPDAALAIGLIAASVLVAGRQFLTLHDVTLSQAALERANEQLQESMSTQHHLARTDPLTGIPNRRLIDEVIDAEVARAMRYGQPLSLLIADVDNLKEINDTYSHATGDETLRTVARIARETCRKSDMVGRYGGDEFVFVLPSTDLEEAAALAERARQRLARTPVDGGAGQSLHPSVSIGVARWDAASMSGPFELLADADRALYAAKAAGRNRTMLAKGDRAFAA